MKLRRCFPVPIRLLHLLVLSTALSTSISAQVDRSTGQTSLMPRVSESILLPVTVTDEKGLLISGLDKSAFTVYEDKIPLEITSFSGGDEPVSIGIIFDLSGSMAGTKKLKAAWEHALRFIELSHTDNDYFVIAFSSVTRVLLDWTLGSRMAFQHLSKFELTSENKSKIPLNTALFDALYLGIEKMHSSKRKRQAIVLITDGQDNASRYTYSEVRGRLKEGVVRLYSVGLLADNDPGSSLGTEGEAVLDELSAISGGKAFLSENTAVTKEVFEMITRELRQQYLISVRPSKYIADGKWHKIKVKVAPPLTAEGRKKKLYVRSREGYFAVKDLP